jgi:drug/metabolite transporter (DMT)-like permease
VDVAATPRQRRAAVWALVTTTLFWGSTFFLMKAGEKALGARLTPDTAGWAALLFLAVRFAASSLAFPLVFPRLLRGARHALPWGAAASIPFAGGFALQLYGLRDVDPSVSALYTSMFVVFTPLLSFLLLRKPPGRSLVLGIAFAVAGLWLVAGEAHVRSIRGELLSLACAFVFSCHILITDRGSKLTDPIGMAWHQVTISAVLLAIPLVFVRPSPFAAVPGALGEREVLVALVVTALFATVGAMALMTHFQRFLSPNHAAVIYTLEPVFAGLFSWMFFGEAFGERKLLGGALIVAGNLACAVRPRKEPGSGERPEPGPSGKQEGD